MVTDICVLYHRIECNGIMLHLALRPSVSWHLNDLAYLCFDLILALWCDIMIGIAGGGFEVEFMICWGRRH